MLFQDNIFYLNLFQDPWKFLRLRKVVHLTIRNDASHDAMLYRQQAENSGYDMMTFSLSTRRTLNGVLHTV